MGDLGDKIASWIVVLLLAGSVLYLAAQCVRAVI